MPLTIEMNNVTGKPLSKTPPGAFSELLEIAFPFTYHKPENITHSV